MYLDNESDVDDAGNADIEPTCSEQSGRLPSSDTVPRDHHTFDDLDNTISGYHLYYCCIEICNQKHSMRRVFA